MLVTPPAKRIPTDGRIAISFKGGLAAVLPALITRKACRSEPALCYRQVSDSELRTAGPIAAARPAMPIPPGLPEVREALDRETVRRPATPSAPQRHRRVSTIGSEFGA
jgi:hypothetical protein